MFKDIFTFLGLDYRNTSLITLYFVVKGISIQKKTDESNKFSLHKFGVKKGKQSAVLNGRTNLLVTIIELQRFQVPSKIVIFFASSFVLKPKLCISMFFNLHLWTSLF